MKLFRMRKRLTLSLLALIVVIVIFYVTRDHCSDDQRNFWLRHRTRDFVLSLSRRASADRFVILAMVDAAFADMAINLYETSFRPNGIESFLFVGTGTRVCAILAGHSLPCFHYADDANAEDASVYGTPVFIRKMNLRTDMIMDALDAGFTVLHTDLDVVFLRNPVPELTGANLSTADMAVLWDNSVFNAGFLVVRPTAFSKMVYERTKAVTLLDEKMDDQKALNGAIDYVRKLHEKNGFNAVVLDTRRYLCGVDYYEKGNRTFASDCFDCTVVHNNWIVSREAKIYRFKEHLTWNYDGQDGYYTSQTRRYIAYDNPTVWADEQESAAEELAALKAALAFGRLLDRVVILPRFHCIDAFDGGIEREAQNETTPPNMECPLNSLLKIASFDSVFAGRYRESSFLSHPKVPEGVKGDLSVPYRIVDKRSEDAAKGKRRLGDAYLSVSLESQKSVGRLVKKLTSKVKVLRFQSLYRSAPSFPDASDQAKFEKMVETAFQRARYRQF